MTKTNNILSRMAAKLKTNNMIAKKIFSSEWTSIAIGGAVMLIGAVVDPEVSTIMCGVGGVIYLFSVVAYYFLKGKI